MTGMDDLATWLRACLDDDERVARAAERFWHGVRVESATMAEEDHVRRWDPARVLAEIDAKRRILDWVDEVSISRAVTWSFDPSRPLRLLALPYADRDGYQQSWRP